MKYYFHVLLLTLAMKTYAMDHQEGPILAEDMKEKIRQYAVNIPQCCLSSRILEETLEHDPLALSKLQWNFEHITQQADFESIFTEQQKTAMKELHSYVSALLKRGFSFTFFSFSCIV